jgi:hypothetical protein
MFQLYLVIKIIIKYIIIFNRMNERNLKNQYL